MLDRRGEESQPEGPGVPVQSALRQWPIQMHLVSPQAPYFQGADVLLAADCVAFAMGGFHGTYLEGRSLAIACPKLDEGQEIYLEKIKSWIDDAKINTLTVAIMEVPCCMGLVALAQRALQESSRQVPLKRVVLGVDGEVRNEEWVTT
jgi:hypothetical protein